MSMYLAWVEYSLYTTYYIFTASYNINTASYNIVTATISCPEDDVVYN